jgi:uncharacterized membrane protein YfcA
MASLLSGLLGIGGGIVLAPLLVILIPLTGSPLDIHQITALTVIQNLAAGLIGVFYGRRSGFVSKSLVLWMGVPIAITSLLGAVLSSFVSSMILQGVFASLTLASALLIVLPLSHSETTAAKDTTFSRLTAAALAGTIGFPAGMVGLAGASLLIPLMLHILKVSTRVALGSSLGIVAIAAAAGAIGKLGTGQVNLVLASVLIATVAPGVWCGGWVAQRTRPKALRYGLAVALVATAGRMFYSLKT